MRHLLFKCQLRLRCNRNNANLPILIVFSFEKKKTLGKKLLIFPQDRDCRYGERPAQVVREAILRVLDLHAVRASLELLGELVDHTATRGTDGMPEALQTARGIHR